jgi:hypothetical protein
VQTWRALLLVYRELAVKLPVGRWRPLRFNHIASPQEINDAMESFLGFPRLVEQLSDNAASVSTDIIHVATPLRSLSCETPTRFWPSPDDTKPQLDEFAPAGSYDSLFVFWPQRNFATGAAVPCDAWGLALAAGERSNGATYAAVANAPAAAWQGEARGEVWLHEWLHGVCAHFARQGHTMPERDADGAELHGYQRSPANGWCEYYHDLMTGQVREGTKICGIPLEAWRGSASFA